MNSELGIIAGPCSLDERNMEQVHKMATDENIAGVRIVGLKSRTNYNDTGMGMGIDFSSCSEMLNGSDFKVLPSVKFAKEIEKETGKIVATEIVIPKIQLDNFEKAGLGREKLLIWNPAVNQLGWNVLEMALSAQKNNWFVGLKNPKWLGCRYDQIGKEESSMEKQWWGNYKYALERDKTIFIQRGVDISDKGLYRNAIVHNVAKKIKEKGENIKMYFDPSHTYGEKMRDKIIEGIVDAVRMKLNDGRFLYDGILIEVGDSKTDTSQHLRLDELNILMDKLAKFREFKKEKNTL